MLSVFQFRGLKIYERNISIFCFLFNENRIFVIAENDPRWGCGLIYIWSPGCMCDQSTSVPVSLEGARIMPSSLLGMCVCSLPAWPFLVLVALRKIRSQCCHLTEVFLGIELCSCNVEKELLRLFPDLRSRGERPRNNCHAVQAVAGAQAKWLLFCCFVLTGSYKSPSGLAFELPNLQPLCPECWDGRSSQPCLGWWHRGSK